MGSFECSANRFANPKVNVGSTAIRMQHWARFFRPTRPSGQLFRRTTRASRRAGNRRLGMHRHGQYFVPRPAIPINAFAARGTRYHPRVPDMGVIRATKPTASGRKSFPGLVVHRDPLVVAPRIQGPLRSAEAQGQEPAGRTSR